MLLFFLNNVSEVSLQLAKLLFIRSRILFLVFHYLLFLFIDIFYFLCPVFIKLLHMIFDLIRQDSFPLLNRLNRSLFSLDLIFIKLLGLL